MGTDTAVVAQTSTATATATATAALKLTDAACVDPDLTKVAAGVTFTLCDDTVGTGTYVPPAGPDLTLLVAGNVKQGVTIAGVAGTLVPSPDLTALIASNVKQGVTIAGVAGTVVPSPDLTALTAGNLKSGVTIAGVSGSVVSESHVNCSSNAEVGCVSTSTYKAADLTNLSAANVKSGVTIAGVAGSFTGITLSAQDLRVGVTAGAVTGTLKVNCRNLNDNVNSPGAVSVDDGNSGLGAPAQLATGSTAANTCEAGNWTDLTPSVDCASDTAHCMVKDLVSGLTWSKPFGNATWAAAEAACNSLTYNGLTGWRMPSQKELMQAYVDGYATVSPNGLAPPASSYMWTRTQLSTSQTYAYWVAPGYGLSNYTLMTAANINAYTCVR